MSEREQTGIFPVAATPRRPSLALPLRASLPPSSDCQPAAFRWFLILTVTVLTGLGLGGCSRQAPAENTPPPAAVNQSAFLSYLEPRRVGPPPTQPSWIAHVEAVDLDRDGLLDVVYCEAKDNTVVWLRQKSRGEFEETVLATNLRAPVHAEASDLDGDGDLDLVVASMSVVFPNNDRIGTVFILENDGAQHFTPHTVLEHTERVTDVRVADLNGDGRPDLVLAQFGYDQGCVSWLENTGNGTYKRHVLLELSGAINVCVADFDGDHRPDVAALLSQQWEEIHVFLNQGGGNFSPRRIWGSTNEDYGSSGLSVCDLNRDGRPDLLYTNGDGFGPAATPGPRPWHGLQWLENAGDGNFRYHRVGSLPGAYCPLGLDLDQDGAMDVVTVAAYADWNNASRNVVSLQWWRNDGRMNFEPRPLARTPKDQITLAAGDFDGTGRPVLVTGGFYIYPPYDAMDRLTFWRRARTP